MWHLLYEQAFSMINKLHLHFSFDTFAARVFDKRSNITSI